MDWGKGFQDKVQRQGRCAKTKVRDKTQREGSRTIFRVRVKVRVRVRVRIGVRAMHGG